jgi:hypothetical protein
VAAIRWSMLALGVDRKRVGARDRHSAQRPRGREQLIVRVGMVLGRMLGAASGLPLPQPGVDRAGHAVAGDESGRNEQ